MDLIHPPVSVLRHVYSLYYLLMVKYLANNNKQAKSSYEYMNDIPVNCLTANAPPVCTGNFCRLISHRLAVTNIINLLRYSYIII